MSGARRKQRRYKMGERLWIVEAQFKDGSWGIASFTGERWVSTNYYQAHRFKRAIQQLTKMQGSKYWSNKRFRVVEYSRAQT